MIAAIVKHQYVTIYLLLILIIYGGSLFFPEPSFVGDIAFEKESDERPKAILDALRDLTTFFAALNGVIFTACCALIVKGPEWNGRPWGRIDKYAFVMIFVAGATSYYGHYLSHVAILEMVTQGVIDPFGNRLQIGQQIQYHAFLTAAVLLGLVMVRLMDGKR